MAIIQKKIGSKIIETCSECDSLLVTYKRRIQFNSIPLLRNLRNITGTINLSELQGMTHSLYADFWRLQFWGLIEEVEHAHYRITQLGKDWLDGLCTVPKFLWIRKHDIKEKSTEEIYVHQVKRSRMNKKIAIQEAKNNSEFDKGD